jgi:hypothetical protein
MIKVTDCMPTGMRQEKDVLAVKTCPDFDVCHETAKHSNSLAGSLPQLFTPFA